MNRQQAWTFMKESMIAGEGYVRQGTSVWRMNAGVTQVSSPDEPFWRDGLLPDGQFEVEGHSASRRKERKRRNCRRRVNP